MHRSENFAAVQSGNLQLADGLSQRQQPEARQLLQVRQQAR